MITHRSVGAGPPLLLINDYAATGADWDPTFLAALAESFEVICPDNRGVGGSEAGEEELTVDAMAADCEAQLDAMEIERCAVAGWSMGGFIAQRFALRAPERVSALTLMATDPGGPDSVPADPAALSRLTDLSGSAREQATRLISLLFSEPQAAQIDAEFGDLVAEARTALDPRVLRAQEAAMEFWHRDASAKPKSGEIPPTLILHGDLDEVIPAANTDPLAAHWLGARSRSSKAAVTP
jgi:pimeloyl-ACP methyl ester carboxylesterase